MMMFHVDPFSSTLHFNDNNNDGAQDYGGDMIMMVLKMMFRKKAVKVLPTVHLTSQGSGAIVTSSQSSEMR